MADQEHGLESPDQGHRLCVNNCGFSGSPATQNMCSKCYGDSRVNPTRRTPPPMPSGPCDEAGHSVQLDIPACSVREEDRAQRVGSLQATASTSQGRCATCRKRIGLTGFRCRCGTTFCGVHRYPERHGCAFDYKAVGREAIAKENPIVKADKLHYKI